MQCYGLTQNLANTVIGNVHLLFLCVNCVTIDPVEFVSVASEVSQLKTAVVGLTATVNSQTTQLPPSSMFQEMVSSLREINESLKSFNEVRDSTAEQLMLQEMREVVRDTHAKVSSNINVQSNQSYADVLKTMDDLKQLTAKTNENLKAVGNVALRNSNVFPNLDSPSRKRRREERNADAPLKTQEKKFIGRKLLAGTSSEVNHGLGVEVVVAAQTERPVRVSPYAKLTKSIYVSRLSNDITPAALTEYITRQLVGVDESDFMLRVLVKKDVDLSTRTFLSYRLACTEALYDKFMDLSFWPSHVRIGEFFETPRPPRHNVTLRDFTETPITEKINPIPQPSSHMATPKTGPKNGSPIVTMETS